MHYSMRISCSGINVGFDNPDCDLPFLSHAHSDHTVGLKRHKKMIASKATVDLANLHTEQVELPGTKMIDAGHILGAKQLVTESDGERVTYTGDFCVKPNIFGAKAEIPQCDRLIMEATYGDPAYVFPPHEEVYSSIYKWIKENDKSNLIIGCYDLGKAQELIRMLNECSIAPLVTEKSEHFNSVYEKHGVKLDRIVIGSDDAEEAMSRRFVGLVPMNRAKKYFAKKLADAFERKTLCAVATGWALHYRFNTDAAFPLSDHSDFNDLVSFIEQTGAKKVEFFCGDGSRVLKAVKGVILNC